MKLLTRAYVDAHRKEIIEEMKSGKIFIYPTDTIYGLGCNAMLSEAVGKIRKIKRREEKPYSVIAPSMDWLTQKCETPKIAREWIAKLPGPYTLILPLKDKEAVSEETLKGVNTLGVRMISHWFYDLIKEAGIPFITTSVNLSGSIGMTSFYDIEESIKGEADYIVYEGSKRGKPSMIVDLSGEKEKIIQR